MTEQLEALDRLIEAWEAGTMTRAQSCTVWKGYAGSFAVEVILLEKTYHGDLNAAKRLHDALLPGWIGDVDTTGFALVYEDERECTSTQSALIPGQSARAWGLAILRAYRAKLVAESLERPPVMG